MNAVHWNRDLTRPLEEIRQREQGWTDKLDREKGVVSFGEMRSGNVRLCVATQIGHTVSKTSPLPGWHCPEIAWAQTQAQAAWYREMEKRGELSPIRTAAELASFQDSWQEGQQIGYLLSLEGADSLVNLDYLHQAFENGLRLLGPAHYGPGRYAAGTGETDGFTPAGLDLLKEMERLDLILDVTHLTDRGFDEALELYPGPIIASHHNCRALVEHQRQLTDEQIKKLISRGSVIGVALDAWMLVPDWIRGTSTPDETGVSLQQVADQLEHVCQLAGSCQHSVIGSDLDGAFGYEQTPMEIDSIAKLPALGSILEERGFQAGDIEGIFSGNALSFFAKNLP